MKISFKKFFTGWRGSPAQDDNFAISNLIAAIDNNHAVIEKRKNNIKTYDKWIALWKDNPVQKANIEDMIRIEKMQIAATESHLVYLKEQLAEEYTKEKIKNEKAKKP